VSSGENGRGRTLTPRMRSAFLMLFSCVNFEVGQAASSASRRPVGRSCSSGALSPHAAREPVPLSNEGADCRDDGRVLARVVTVASHRCHGGVVSVDHRRWTASNQSTLSRCLRYVDPRLLSRAYPRMNPGTRVRQRILPCPGTRAACDPGARFAASGSSFQWWFRPDCVGLRRVEDQRGHEPRRGLVQATDLGMEVVAQSV
jgi:hypothetical protein